MKKSAALGLVAFALSLAAQSPPASTGDFSPNTEGSIRTTDSQTIRWTMDPRFSVIQVFWLTRDGQNAIWASSEYLGYDSQGSHYLKREAGTSGTGYFKLTRKAASLYAATAIENAPPGLTLPGAPPPEPPAEPQTMKGPVKKNPITITSNAQIFLTIPDTGEKVEVVRAGENKMMNTSIYATVDKTRIFGVNNDTGKVIVIADKRPAVQQ